MGCVTHSDMGSTSQQAFRFDEHLPHGRRYPRIEQRISFFWFLPASEAVENILAPVADKPFTRLNFLFMPDYYIAVEERVVPANTAASAFA